MTKEEAKIELRKIIERTTGDPETNHSDADDVLLELIDDPEITALWTSIFKWFA